MTGYHAHRMPSSGPVGGHPRARPHLPSRSTVTEVTHDQTMVTIFLRSFFASPALPPSTCLDTMHRYFDNDAIIRAHGKSLPFYLEVDALETACDVAYHDPNAHIQILHLEDPMVR